MLSASLCRRIGFGVCYLFLSTMHLTSAVEYPQARVSDVVDELHGEKVADPYRWLEDIDSGETKRWVEAEAALTRDWLAEGDDPREGLRERVRQLWDYEKVSAPRTQGGRTFYNRNSGLQNQSVLYWHPEGEPQEAKILIDPNALSEDGTVALSGASVSDDGKWLAYGLSKAGSDWQEWRVREVATGEDQPEVLKWVKFSSASWSPDSKGFCYSRYDEPTEGDELSEANYFQKVYYHLPGTEQNEDRLLYERPDQKEWGFHAGFSEDGQWLVMTVWKGAGGKNGLFYRSATDDDAEWVELFNRFDSDYTFVGNDDDVFYIWTDRDAANGRLVAVDLNRSEKNFWRSVVGEAKHRIAGVSLFGDEVIIEYLEDARSRVAVFDLNETNRRLREVELPGMGAIHGFDGYRSDSETYYTFTGFTDPGTVFRYDTANGESSLHWRPELKFDPADFETRQEFVTSKDGTKVPVFLVFRKGQEMDGERPVYQYGYGGFNIDMTPSFSVSNLVWMERGGVYAQAVLRGGSEYGRTWHDAGKREHKQNVFDDFIAASEWLIEQGITRSEKLAIGGGSNGGLLVGACMTQRPELFGACVPAVGVMDMLRFQKFTIGWAWQDEYGYPEKSVDDFRVLRAYSPYHNLKKGVCYPPTLVTTADHDDRVFPAHSFKFAAALQAAQGCDENPVLIRIEQKAGHGAGKPTSKIIDEIADKWAFLFRVLRME